MTPEQSKLLSEILKKAEATPSGVAVFDLDSTLYKVNPRTLKIIKEFADHPEHRSNHNNEAEILRRVEELVDTYHVKEQLAHLGLVGRSDEFYKDLFQFWSSRFFSNDYLKFDEPYEGAVEFVNEIHSHDIKVIYLTGRDVKRMGKGTADALRASGFPMDVDNVELALKPLAGMDDADFKTQFLDAIKAEVVWFFENEAHNINEVELHHPHIEIIYFDSVHSGKGDEPGKHIPRIKSFKY